MTYCFYNAHPEGKLVGDCVKRAISKAENRNYREVSLELNRLKKITGAKKFNGHDNLKYYFVQKRYHKISFPAVRNKKRMTPEEFSKVYSKGSYILRLAHHLTCCVDGVIYDTWDCTQKCVYNAWKVR